jgi:hypothetical protein
LAVPFAGASINMISRFQKQTVFADISNLRYLHTPEKFRALTIADGRDLCFQGCRSGFPNLRFARIYARNMKLPKSSMLVVALLAAFVARAADAPAASDQPKREREAIFDHQVSTNAPPDNGGRYDARAFSI